MERPFAYLGFSFLFGLLVLFLTDVFIVKTLVCVILFIILGSFIIKKFKPEFVLLFIGLLLSVFSLDVFKLSTPDFNFKSSGNVVATINKMIYESDYGFYYDFSIKEIDNRAVENIRVKVFSENILDCDEKDLFTGTLRFYDKNDEKTFSEYKNLMSAGFVAKAKIDYNKENFITQTNEFSFIEFLRKNINLKIESLYQGDVQALIKAMLIGNKTSLSSDVYDDFRNSGFSHMIVISGMHLSILFATLCLFLRKIKVPMYITCLIIIPLIVIYVLVCGSNKSVVRASIMFIFVLIGNSLGEENNSINFLGLSILIICINNPYSACDMGFLLSISATGGILKMSDPIKLYLLSKIPQQTPENIRRKTGFVIELFTVSVSAFLFVTPVILLFTGIINPLSVAISIILTYPATLLIIVAVLSVVSSFISFMGIITGLLVDFVIMCANLILETCSTVAEIGVLIPVLNQRIATILFVAILFIVAGIIVFKPSKSVKITGVVALIFVILLSYIYPMFQVEKAQLIISDNGDSVFVAVIEDDKVAVLSSGGYSEYLTQETLNECGIKNIEYLVCDENDLSEVEKFLIDEYNIKKFVKDEAIDFSEKIKIKSLYNNKIVEMTYEDKRVLIDLREIFITHMSADIIITPSHCTNSKANLTFLNQNNNKTVSLQNEYISVNDKIYSLYLEDFKIRRLK